MPTLLETTKGQILLGNMWVMKRQKATVVLVSPLESSSDQIANSAHQNQELLTFLPPTKTVVFTATDTGERRDRFTVGRANPRPPAQERAV